MLYKKYLAPDEEPIWVVQPNQTLFIFVYGLIRSPLILGILLAIASVLLSFSSEPKVLMDLFSLKFLSLAVIVTFVITLFFLSAVHHNTYYILTPQRVILTGGVFGTDVKSIELEQITDIQLNVNPIDQIFQSGKVSVTTAGSHGRQKMYENTLLALDQPDKIFQSLRGHLKKQSRS